MKKFYLLSIFLALFFSVLTVGNPEAAIYYIDGSNGNDSNPGTIASPWKTISKANSTLKAGDMANIRVGTYSSEQIKPANSGTSGNYITYQNYNDEEVIVSSGTPQISLSFKNYIKIDGIKFYYPSSRGQWGKIADCSYIKIHNCIFDNYKNAFAKYRLFRIQNSDYCQFINNIWTADDVPWANGNIQFDMVSTYDVSHTMFKNCTFGDASHSSLFGPSIGDAWGDPVHPDGDFVVVKDCLFTNKWRTALGSLIHQKRLLIDNCTFAGIGRLNDECPWADDRNRITPALYISVNYSIFRGNTIYGSDSSIFLRADGKPYYYNTSYNWLYNNTIYDTDKTDNNTINSGHAIFGEVSGSGYTIHNNKFKNNIFWKIEGDPLGREIDVHSAGDTAPPYDNEIKHNIFGQPDSSEVLARYALHNSIRNISTLEQNHKDWISGAKTHYNVDPLFIAPDAASPDFRLQKGSQAIDRGTWLTTIASATANNQTSITLDDATPFYSGAGAPWFIEGETGDVIKTQNGQLTTIQHIDYKTNTIAVSPGINIVRGEGVSLNYSGLAPDIGAYEYDNSLTLSSPTGLMIE